MAAPAIALRYLILDTRGAEVDSPFRARRVRHHRGNTMSEPNEYMTPPPPPSSGSPSAEERQWAMFAHLSAIVAAVVGLSFLGPLIIWLVKKDTMPFVDDQGKEALNFNITVLIVFAILWILTVVTLGIGILLTGPLMFVVGLAALVLVIIAGIKANEGVAYRYPFALRLVK
jgi:uncharacterized Tic20 family protein